MPFDSFVTLNAKRTIRLAIAASIFAVAFAIRILILPIDAGAAYLTFYPAAAFSAILCGLSPSLLVIFLCGFTGYFVFITPSFALKTDYKSIITIFTYIATSVIVCLAIESLRKLKREHLLLIKIVNSSNNAIISTDINGNITSWNPQAESIFGYSRSEIIGMPITVLIPKDKLAEEVDKLQKIQHGEPIARYETIRTHKDGTRIDVLVNLFPLLNNYGGIIGATLTTYDLTDQKNVSALFHASRYDKLTELPNRLMLGEYLAKAASRMERSNRQLAVLFLDLDGFKSINDTYGHETGDRLLTAVAERLKQYVRMGDFVSRYGGDEFVLVIEDCDPTRLPSISEKIIFAIETPYDSILEDVSINNVSCSIGISLYPNCAQQITDVIKTADAAMYIAKKSGKGKFSFFCTEHPDCKAGGCQFKSTPADQEA